MIVKVQVPLRTSGEPMALIYNEDRTLLVEMPIDRPLKKAMAGKKKRFFNARLVGEALHLDSVAPWQNW